MAIICNFHLLNIGFQNNLDMFISIVDSKEVAILPREIPHEWKWHKGLLSVISEQFFLQYLLSENGPDVRLNMYNEIIKSLKL